MNIAKNPGLQEQEQECSPDYIYTSQQCSKYPIHARAQVLISAKVYSIALRDCRSALHLDPTHDKTLLRLAHCYENIDISKSLEVRHHLIFKTSQGYLGSHTLMSFRKKYETFPISQPYHPFILHLVTRFF